MKPWIPITYREVYDIPRIFLARGEGHVFLFDCRFDSEKEDYQETYNVYLMPKMGNEDLSGSWEGLSAKAERLLGEVRTSEVSFDPTLREQINTEVLRRFGF